MTKLDDRYIQLGELVQAIRSEAMETQHHVDKAYYDKKVDKAIAEERERCAKIAETYFDGLDAADHIRKGDID